MNGEEKIMEAPVPVKVKGVYIAEAEGGSPAPVVLLEDERSRIVPIFVGLSEAISIHHALTGELSPRPMTHDLMKQILDTFQVSLIRVVIHEIKGNTYYANLYLNIDGEEVVVDSRPSDAIALAVRIKAPIYVAESVISSTKQMGVLASSLLEDDDELKSLISDMNPEDFGKYKM